MMPPWRQPISSSTSDRAGAALRWPPSEPVRRRCHHLRHQPHQFLHGRWQAQGAGTFGHVGVTGFVIVHLLQDLAGALVLGWQLLQMALQMGTDLVFGFLHKAQAPAVADNAGAGTNAKRHQIPQRIEKAGVAVQFIQTLLAPGQMILFFLGGNFHLAADARQPCGESLAGIQGLGADFAGVIHPHQAGHMAAFGRIESGNVGAGGGEFAVGALMTAGHGAHGVVGLADQPVEQAVVTFSACHFQMLPKQYRRDGYHYRDSAPAPPDTDQAGWRRFLTQGDNMNLRIKSRGLWAGLATLALLGGCTQETQNTIGRAIQNWTGTDGVLDIYAGDKLVKRFIKIDKLSTALATSGSGEARSYRFGYGIMDVNQNLQVDPGEKKVYFEISDFSTPYIFYENPGL